MRHGAGLDLATQRKRARQNPLANAVLWRPAAYQVPLATAPKQVDTVINHRVVNQSTIIVGVSGGVQIDPMAYAKPSAIKTDDYGRLKAKRTVLHEESCRHAAVVVGSSAENYGDLDIRRTGRHQAYRRR